MGKKGRFPSGGQGAGDPAPWEVASKTDPASPKKPLVKTGIKSEQSERLYAGSLTGGAGAGGEVF